MTDWKRITDGLPPYYVPVLIWGAGLQYPFVAYRDRESKRWNIHGFQPHKMPAAWEVLLTHWMEMPEGLKTMTGPDGATYYNQNPAAFIPEKEIVARNVMNDPKVEASNPHAEYMNLPDRHWHQWEPTKAFGDQKCSRCGITKENWELDSYPPCNWSPGIHPANTGETGKAQGTHRAHAWSVFKKPAYCLVCTAKVDGPGSYDPCPGKLTDWSAKEPFGVPTMGHVWVKNELGNINCKHCYVSWGTLAATQICQPLKEKWADKPSAISNGYVDSQKIRFATQQDPTSYQTTGYMQPVVSVASADEMRRIRQAALDLAVRSLEPGKVYYATDWTFDDPSNLVMEPINRAPSHDPKYILSVAKTFEAYLKNGTVPGNNTPQKKIRNRGVG
jgi:hypothetical protein